MNIAALYCTKRTLLLSGKTRRAVGFGERELYTGDVSSVKGHCVMTSSNNKHYSDTVCLSDKIIGIVEVTTYWQRIENTAAGEYRLIDYLRRYTRKYWEN